MPQRGSSCQEMRSGPLCARNTVPGGARKKEIHVVETSTRARTLA